MEFDRRGIFSLGDQREWREFCGCECDVSNVWASVRRIGGSVCVRNVKGVLALVVGFVRRVSRVVYVVRIRVE